MPALTSGCLWLAERDRRGNPGLTLSSAQWPFGQRHTIVIHDRDHHHHGHNQFDGSSRHFMISLTFHDDVKGATFSEVMAMALGVGQ
jgi:hypothetical protein